MISVVLVVSILLVSPAIAVGSSPSDAVASQVFGYTNVGNSQKETFGGIYLSNFTSPSDLGTISQISVYLATGGTSATAVIYSDDNGAPGSLLAESVEVYQSGTSERWVDLPLSYNGTPNTVYWLGILFSNAGTYYFATGASDKAIYYTSQTTAANTFPLGNSSPAEQLSVYATYTPLNQSVEGIHTFLFWVLIIGLIIAAVLTILILNARKKEKKREK
jgi:hypothetical protein